MSSVYDALQRARRGGNDSLVPRQQHPPPRDTRPTLWTPMGPLSAHLAPLLAALRPLLDGKEGVVVHVAAANRGEGASTIAREFALLAGTSGHRRTLLIDADRSDPQTARSFACDTQRGLIDCLWDGYDEADVLQPVAGTLLSVASLVGEAGRSLGDTHIVRELYTRMSSEFMLTVVDCPPIGSSAYSELLPEAVDGVILVVQAERTRPAVIAHARDLVQQAGGHVLGAVLNRRNNYIPDFLYRML